MFYGEARNNEENGGKILFGLVRISFTIKSSQSTRQWKYERGDQPNNCQRSEQTFFPLLREFVLQKGKQVFEGEGGGGGGGGCAEDLFG